MKKIVITYKKFLIIWNWFQDKDGWYQTTKFPIAVRRAFRNILKQLTVVQEAYLEDENDVLGKYRTDEYSDPDESNPALRKVKPEFLVEFAKDQSELLSVQAEIEFKPIDESTIGGVELLDKDYQVLSIFLTEEDEQVE